MIHYHLPWNIVFGIFTLIRQSTKEVNFISKQCETVPYNAVEVMLVYF